MAADLHLILREAGKRRAPDVLAVLGLAGERIEALTGVW